MNEFMLFSKYTATPDICTLSLHDALPITPEECVDAARGLRPRERGCAARAFLAQPRVADRALDGDRNSVRVEGVDEEDRKSTRLNYSHANISYAVFCSKKKQNGTTAYSTN